jgi:hypothetical protein
MVPRKRPPAVNERMQEAHRMRGVVEKAMEGERLEERHPTLHGAPHHENGRDGADNTTSL